MTKKKVVVEEVVEESPEETLKTNFLVSNGKEQLRVVAMRDCWALQKWSTNINRVTKEETAEWSSFKYFSDLGSVANKVFQIRLRNSEAASLTELASMGKEIAKEVRKEFGL